MHKGQKHKTYFQRLVAVFAMGWVSQTYSLRAAGSSQVETFI